MPDLSIQSSFNYNKGGIAIQRSLNAQINAASAIYSAQVVLIDSTGEELDAGSIAAYGVLMLNNLAQAVVVTQPAAPTISNQGTPGAVTAAYKIIAKQSDGTYSVASSAATIATSAATLNGTNFNRLSWTADPNATGGYDIYRTTHPTSPTTTGKIGSVAAGSGTLTFDDTGLAGDSSTAPSVAADNLLLVSENGTSFPIALKGGEFCIVRWNSAAGAPIAKANTRACQLEYIFFSD